MFNVIYNTNKPDNPKESETFFDTSKNQRYIFKNGNWYEINFKLPKKFNRIEKIKAIFK